jgi:hypothetical protein
MERRKAKGLNLEELRDQFSTNVDFIYRDQIPEGQPCILNGREGIGKTSICMAIAKEIILIDKLDNKGNVIWIATEGRVLDTVNKMEMFNLNERFYVAQKADGNFKFNFQQSSDINELGIVLKDFEPIVCVFIDSIRGMSPLGDNDDKIGGVMHRINSLVCDKFHSALVYLDHHKKGKADDLLDKAVGTTAKTAAVSVVLSIIKKSAYVREIKCAKSNIGPIPDLISMKIGDRIVIKSPSEYSAETMATKAEAFLLELGGEKEERSAVEVYDLAEDQGISPDVLKKVKLQLGIVSRRKSINDPWLWAWP